MNLIPYSPVTPQRTQRKRPVLFTPTALAKTIIQKILNMGAAMDFDIGKPGQFPYSRASVRFFFSVFELKIKRYLVVLRWKRNKERDWDFRSGIVYCTVEYLCRV